ncbi:MAG: cation-translocating P-type ATPase [Syntrophales bacterium]
MDGNATRTPWHSRPVERVAADLATGIDTGLSAAEAGARLDRFGPNELAERPPVPLWKLLAAQVGSFVVGLLIAAGAIAALMGDWVEAAAIMAIVLLNAVLGVFQESRAEAALAALRKMAAPEADVVRDGHRRKLSARELVPGDVVLLEAGNFVPADVRLAESANLKIDESSLTGESDAVQKNAGPIVGEDAPLGDRVNAAYMGSIVTYGRGRGIVVGTGMSTEIGLIAEMIQSYGEEPTPLQKKLAGLGKTLGAAVVVICALVFAVTLLRDTDIEILFTAGFDAYFRLFQGRLVETFLVAVSLAIAAVPEGLPAIVTISLALGMREMVKRHALIRKLVAVETLGSATVICSDKTGTLTENEMTAVRLWVASGEFTIDGRGYQPEGRFHPADRPGEDAEVLTDRAAGGLLWAALLANDAVLERTGEAEGRPVYRMVGDPTEGALIVAAAKAGLWRTEIERRYPRVAEVPFDSVRKRMSTVHELNDPSPGDGNPFAAGDAGRYALCVKGAPDLLLEKSSRLLERSGPVPLRDGDRQRITAAGTQMASQALRVLGVACRRLDRMPEAAAADDLEQDLIFVGLVGMIDPARAEVAPAIAKARRAGVRTVMVTGDYPETARAIAAEIGLLRADGRVRTGAEIDQLDDAALRDAVEDTDVFARVSPEHKVRIVAAFRMRGHVVAMTGDGVNDAPALKRADIGVAMGVTGTDVAKETADMVLTDDNYVSIVSAVEQGRIITGNIRKFVFYLLSCNVAEVAIIFLAALAGVPAPLTPIQLLWLNLLTDGAPALALGMEKGDPDIMEQPPRQAGEAIVNRAMIIRIALLAAAVTGVVLAAFLIGWSQGDRRLAQTMAFATLALAELPIAYAIRSERHPLLAVGVLSNPWMQRAVGVSLALILTVMYVPVLNEPFNTVPLGPGQWMLIVPLAAVPAVVAEAGKRFLRRDPRP